MLALISSALILHAQGRRIQGLAIARWPPVVHAPGTSPVNLFTRAMYSWLGRLPFQLSSGIDCHILILTTWCGARWPPLQLWSCPWGVLLLSPSHHSRGSSILMPHNRAGEAW